jgi:hypothetical protein
MQIEQTRWSQSPGWIPVHPNKLGVKAQLVLLISCVGRKLSSLVSIRMAKFFHLLPPPGASCTIRR